MLKLNNISFAYPTSPAKIFDGFSAEFANSEITLITGKNGSGKSTLALILAKLAKVQSGEVQADGICGIVFQDPSTQVLFETVQEDLEFMLKNREIPKDEWDSRIKKALAQVGMENFENANPQKFSGGQKQRIAIACALVLKADILIFDEASAHLDGDGKERFRRICEEETRRGACVIVITNDLSETKFANKVIEL